jgi:hypothetical protein
LISPVFCCNQFVAYDGHVVSVIFPIGIDLNLDAFNGLHALMIVPGLMVSTPKEIDPQKMLCIANTIKIAIPPELSMVSYLHNPAKT